MAQLLVAGDFYPGRRTAPLLAEASAQPLVGDLAALFEAADATILNLEGPLVESSTPRAKIGPVHSIPKQVVRGLLALGVDVANLANNHIMDHGETGFRHTLDVCRQSRIGWVGGGEDLESARAPWLREVAGTRLAVLAYAEHEFSIAGPKSCGAAPLDPIDFTRTISRLQTSVDRTIVLLHAGNEYCPFPRPTLRDLAHYMVEQGADVVIFQHSHCVGCWEHYRDGVIVYGQGNFIFDDPKAHPCELEGLLLKVALETNRPATVEFIPFAQNVTSPGIQRMQPSEEKIFLDAMAERSRRIKEPGFLEEKWREFCLEKKRNYLGIIHGFGRRLRRLDARFGILGPLFSSRHARMMLHMIRCESHREALTEILEELDRSNRAA